MSAAGRQAPTPSLLGKTRQALARRRLLTTTAAAAIAPALARCSGFTGGGDDSLLHLQGQHGPDDTATMAFALINGVPVAVVFVVSQRYVVQGFARSGLR